MDVQWALRGIGIALILGGSSGCGGEAGTSPAASGSTLAGVDANHDGVRDDVETYIDTAYPVPANADTNNALRQYAKAAQSSILDASDTSLSVTHVTERFRALECLMSRQPSDFHAIFVELRARILDTNPRSEAYLKADGQAAAVNLPLFPADQWGGACI